MKIETKRWLTLGSLATVTLLSGCAHKAKAANDTSLERAPKIAAAKKPEPSSVSLNGSADTQFREAILHFGFNDAVLEQQSRDLLEKIATTMKRDSKSTVNISGHCDDRGTEEYNLALGNRRAEVARKYLIDLGIEGSRILTVSYGDAKPAVQGQGEQVWAANRRDEVKVTD